MIRVHPQGHLRLSPVATEVTLPHQDAHQEAGIERVAFDRGGYKYHGRVKALADAAREIGLEF